MQIVLLWMEGKLRVYVKNKCDITEAIAFSIYTPYSRVGCSGL